MFDRRNSLGRRSRAPCRLARTGPARSFREAQSSLRHLLEEHLRFRRLEDAPIPFHVVATDVLSGEDVRLSRGEAVDAVPASAAIPVVFLPVHIDGRDLIDGGVVNNTPISHAVALGADVVWVLSTGYPCAPPHAPRRASAMATRTPGKRACSDCIATEVMVRRMASVD